MHRYAHGMTFYVNVHQTLAIGLATATVAAYIFDFKGFRKSVNEAIIGKRAM